MVFKLGAKQFSDLQLYRSNNSTLDDAYKTLASAGKGNPEVNQAALRFFEGAAKVNKNQGAFAEFTAFRLRFLS